MAVPSDFAGLVAWYKADSITGAADSDTVLQWDDSSGNARHLTTISPPNYQTGELNGLPMVRFDGGDDSIKFEAGSGFVTGTTCTLAVVYRRQGTGAANDRSMAFTATGAVNDYDNAASFLVYEGGANDREAILRNLGGETAQTPHPGNTVPMLMTFWFDGTNANQRYNRAAASTPSVASTGSFNIARIVVGAGFPSAVANFGEYDFAEICLYDNDLGSTNRTALEDYLWNKWLAPPAPPTLRVTQGPATTGRTR